MTDLQEQLKTAEFKSTQLASIVLNLEKQIKQLKDENTKLRTELETVKPSGRPAVTKNTELNNFIPGFPKLKLTRRKSTKWCEKLKKNVVLPEQALCTLCNKVVKRLADKKSHPCARTYTCNGSSSKCKSFRNPVMHKMKEHVLEVHTDKLKHMDKKTALKFANIKNPEFQRIKDKWIVEKENPKFYVDTV